MNNSPNKDSKESTTLISLEKLRFSTRFNTLSGPKKTPQEEQAISQKLKALKVKFQYYEDKYGLSNPLKNDNF